jgi:hypothetical protein
MNRGGFGGAQAPVGTPAPGFYDQGRFGGGVNITSPSEGVSGLLKRAEGTPPAPYYTPGASVEGTSPAYAGMYGVGSPFVGPQDIFGGY